MHRRYLKPGIALLLLLAAVVSGCGKPTQQTHAEPSPGRSITEMVFYSLPMVSIIPFIYETGR